MNVATIIFLIFSLIQNCFLSESSIVYIMIFISKIHIVLGRIFDIQNDQLQYICSKTHKCNKNVCAYMTWYERMWYKTSILHHHISQDNFLQGTYFPKPNIWLPLLSQHFEILCIKYCSIGNVFASPFRKPNTVFYDFRYGEYMTHQNRLDLSDM